MATYQQIRANDRWFRHQIDFLEQIADRCDSIQSDAQCIRIADDAWPTALAEFKDKYSEVAEAVRGSGPTSYGTGASHLRQLSSALDDTRRAYLRVEAAAESLISDWILALLDD